MPSFLAHDVKLERLCRQLDIQESHLRLNPLVKPPFKALQVTLHFLNLHSQWLLAGSNASLILTFQAALFAQEKEKSQSGFLGQGLARLIREMARLMQVSVEKNEQSSISLILSITQILGLGMIYMTTQLLDRKKTIREKNANSDSLLLRDLGLTFLLGSQAIEHALRAMSLELGLQQTSQKKVTDLSMGLILTLLLLIDEKQYLNREDFVTIFSQFINPTFDSIENSLMKGQMQESSDGKTSAEALNHLNLLRNALAIQDFECFRQSFISSFDFFDLSYEEIKKEIQFLVVLCSQLSESFNNIFNPFDPTATALNQAA